MIETSMLTAKRHNLKMKAHHGHRGARAALKLLEDMDSLLATILLWNNFANVVIASLATLLAVRLISDSQAVLSVTSIVTTLVILIFAEITPKAIGVRFADSIASHSSLWVLALIKILPIGKLLSKLIAKVVSKDIPEKSAPSRSTLAVPELLAIVQDKNTLAEVDEHQKAMLYKLIGLHELAVRDIMSDQSDIEHVDISDSFEHIINKLYKSTYVCLPLCNDGLNNVIGILNVHKVLAKHRQKALTKQQLNKLASEPFFLPETIDPVSALRELVKRPDGICLIADEYGGLVGMITLADYIRHLFRTVTQQSTETEPAADGQRVDVAIVSGDTSVREVNLRYLFQLPEDRGTTMATLIVDELGSYPQVGTQISIDNTTIVVMEMEEQRIVTVRIARQATGSSEEND